MPNVVFLFLPTCYLVSLMGGQISPFLRSKKCATKRVFTQAIDYGFIGVDTVFSEIWFDICFLYLLFFLLFSYRVF